MVFVKYYYELDNGISLHDKMLHIIHTGTGNV